MKPKVIALPEVSFSEFDGVRHLHLGTEWVQGSMRIGAPFELELEYVQRMMAWLLFAPEGVVPGGHAMQLGLGAGALTKFCFKQLGMTCTAIELNPQVLAVCEGWFKLPPQGPRLRVVLADAARGYLDDAAPVAHIVAERVPDEGLGRAINDRLRRAAHG